MTTTWEIRVFRKTGHDSVFIGLGNGKEQDSMLFADADSNLARSVFREPIYWQAFRILEAVLLVLTFLHRKQTKAEKVILRVNDLFAYNILTHYLETWESHAWITSQNYRLPYQDLLEKLSTLISEFQPETLLGTRET